MSSPTSGSTSRTVLLVIALLLVAVMMLVPGLVAWPRLFGSHLGSGSWPIFGALRLMSVLNLALAIWVGVDAERRSGQGILWGLLVFFTSIVGLIVYLLVSPGLERRQTSGVRAGTACPSCRAVIQPAFKVCPYCGEKLERKCPGCASEVRGDWKVCPHCGTSLTS